MSSTMASAMSWCASSAPSHWDRLRPRISGRSQARCTTWIATSGGKSALSTAAGGVSQAIQALGEKPLGPFAHHGPLGAHSLGHLGLRVPRSQEENDLPPTGQPCRESGRPLPPFQGLALFGGEDNVP